MPGRVAGLDNLPFVILLMPHRLSVTVWLVYSLCHLKRVSLDHNTTRRAWEGGHKAESDRLLFS